MSQEATAKSVRELGAEIDSEIQALTVHSTPSLRAVRRKYSRRLKQADAAFVFRLVGQLLEIPELRWFAYELIAGHKAAFERLDETKLLELGRGIDSWWSVDAFARILAGPAWLGGRVSDDVVHRWARSQDRWWRRAALVSTVALNVRSQDGSGDVQRTISVCRILVGDRDDMVVKAMSWALRELVAHDADAVARFLDEHEKALAPRLKREVGNKLATGLKNPKGTGGQ